MGRPREESVGASLGDPQARVSKDGRDQDMDETWDDRVGPQTTVRPVLIPFACGTTPSGFALVRALERHGTDPKEGDQRDDEDGGRGHEILFGVESGGFCRGRGQECGQRAVVLESVVISSRAAKTAPSRVNGIPGRQDNGVFSDGGLSSTG